MTDDAIRPPSHAHPSRPRPEVWAALVWSALAAALALGWAARLIPAPPATTPALDSPLQLLPAAGGGALLFGVAVLGVATAAAMLLGTGARSARRTRRAAWALAGVVLMLMPGYFLAFLGYTLALPVVGWLIPGLAGAYVAAVVEPATLLSLFGVSGVLAWTGAAWRHGRGGGAGCPDCGRGGDWSSEADTVQRLRALRRGRVAVALGAACALAYPAVRLPWAFGIPLGMSELDAETATVGLGLGGAALVGVLLMTGLVADWGVRFPRLVPGVGGRRVPVSLAVVPAVVVVVALVTTGASTVVGMVAGPGGALVEFDGLWWVHGLALAATLPWGIALAVATAAYAVRRRGVCATCGLGEPEQAPSVLRGAKPVAARVSAAPSAASAQRRRPG